MDILLNENVVITRIIDDDYPKWVFLNITFDTGATMELFNKIGRVLKENVSSGDVMLKTGMKTHTSYQVNEEYIEEDNRRRKQAELLMTSLQQTIQSLRELNVWVGIADGEYRTPLEWRVEQKEVVDTTTGKYELEFLVGGTLYNKLKKRKIIE